MENKYIPQYHDPKKDNIDWLCYYKFEDVANTILAFDWRIEFDKQSDAKAFIDEKILEDQSKIEKVVWESK